MMGMGLGYGPPPSSPYHHPTSFHTNIRIMRVLGTWGGVAHAGPPQQGSPGGGTESQGASQSHTSLPSLPYGNMGAMRICRVFGANSSAVCVCQACATPFHAAYQCAT